MGARWRYLLGELGIGLRRNKLMTMATLVTVTVSLALLGGGLLVQRQIDKTRDLFYSNVEVSIFLKDDIADQQRAALQEELSSHALVSGVLFESKQQAWQHFKEIFADDKAFVESVQPEDLPASFRVKLVDPEQFAVIESQFKGYPGVDDITDQRQVLERLFNLMNTLMKAAFWIALLQFVGAVALISTTIRMTAFARREQTGIMKLVGATNWYIRLPFVLEGVLAGVSGGVLAGTLLIVAHRTFLADLRSQMPLMPHVGLGDVVAVIPILVIGGAVVSAIAAFLSLRRFLSV